jgi:hypothetical protein
VAQRAGDTRVVVIRAWAHVLLRDIGSPLAGFAMLGYETIFENADRPWIIGAALTLLGYPVADRIDKLLKGRDSSGDYERKGGNGTTDHEGRR